MKTIRFLFCLLFLAIAMPITLLAQRDQLASSVPQAVNPYDYFKLGETAWALCRFEYYRAIHDSLRDRLKENRALMERLDIPADVLATYDALAATAGALPFSVGFNKWTPTDQQKWKTDGWTSMNKLLGGLRGQVQKNPQAAFYYFLGLSSIKLGWSIPQDLNQNGLLLADLINTQIKPTLANFKGIGQQQELMATLAPNAQAAVQTITGIAARTDDPLGPGITAEDVNKAAAACETLRQLARDNKLVR